ncbi:MAG TPA: CopY family transcriptional regulator [Opitutae bacterium]|nr:CopY family transcriptional regulator [Opitutae bacterium]
MKKKPSDFELQILGVLWESSPLTVREVRSALTDEKERAYTSVLSVMQVMEKKGLLRREKPESGNADLWIPAVERSAVTKPLMHGLVRQLFGGRPSAVMQQLLDGDHVDAAELAEIRKLLKDYESDVTRKADDV